MSLKTLINKEVSRVILNLYYDFLKINNLQSKLSQEKYHNVEFQSH